MASSYEKVKGSKLTFKGGVAPERTISKKTKKKKSLRQPPPENSEDPGAGEAPTTTKTEETEFEIDTGTGHAPDGKKSKKYEELFPVETRKHGYVVPTEDSREAALVERIKKKADRYCK